MRTRRLWLTARLNQLVTMVLALRDATDTHADEIKNSLRRISATQGHHSTLINGLIERTRNMATQQDVDALAGQLGDIASGLGSALDGIQSDLDQLAEQHPDVDLSSIRARVDELAPLAERAAAIDSENPAAAPEPTPGQGDQTL